MLFILFCSRIQNKAHLLNVSEKWHSAFSGAQVDSVRRVLDFGDLHIPGMLKTYEGGVYL